MNSRKICVKQDRRCHEIWKEKEEKFILPDKHIRSFRAMIHFEETVEVCVMKALNRSEVRVYFDASLNKFYIPYDVRLNLNAWIDAIDRKNINIFTITRMMFGKQVSVSAQKMTYESTLKRFYFDFDNRTFLKQYTTKNTLWQVDFKINRLPFQMQHFALSAFESDEMFNYFTNFETELRFGDLTEETTMFGNLNKKDNEDSIMLGNLNQEQNIVVKAILSMEVGQKPFMLHGPPGTAKPRNYLDPIFYSCIRINQTV